MNNWCNDIYRDKERAIREFGKYRLSKEYKHFFRSSTQWNQMSAEKQQDHIKKFYKYVPESTSYKKPQNAGKKVGESGKDKKRVRLPSPELVCDRVKMAPSPAKVACSSSSSAYNISEIDSVTDACNT